MMYLFPKGIVILAVLGGLSVIVVQSNDQCECGLVNVQSRVSHGSEVNYQKYPWVTFLEIWRKGQAYLCTGSLIDDRTILTASHCVEEDGHYMDPSRFMIFLGINTRNDAYGHLALDVEKIFTHPQRNITHNHNDIALLRLKDPVKFTKNVRPACLLSKRDMSILGSLKVAGFGRLSEKEEAIYLQEADIDFVDRQTCFEKLSLYKASDSSVNLDHFSESVMCGKGKGMTMVCHGDSGGPLMHQNKDGKMVIVGLSQYIFKLCGSDADVADLFADVGLFIDFIKEHSYAPCFVNLS